MVWSEIFKHNYQVFTDTIQTSAKVVVNVAAKAEETAKSATVLSSLRLDYSQFQSFQAMNLSPSLCLDLYISTFVLTQIEAVNKAETAARTAVHVASHPQEAVKAGVSKVATLSSACRHLYSREKIDS